MNIGRLTDGRRFRFEHNGQEGEVLAQSPCGAYVRVERPTERTFTTGDGRQVTIKKTTERYTVSNAVEVTPLRRRKVD